MSRTLVIRKIELSGRSFYFDKKLWVYSDRSETHNVLFYTDKLLVNPSDSPFTDPFETLTSYRFDPEDEAYKDIMRSGVKQGIERSWDFLKETKNVDARLAWKATSGMKLGLNNTEKVMNFVKIGKGMSPLEALSSVIGAGTQENMFESIPGIGPILGTKADEWKKDKRIDDNMNKWDAVKGARTFADVINIKDKSNIAFIHCDFDLTKEQDYELPIEKNTELTSIYSNVPYDWLNFGVQFGTDLYVFNSVSMK